MSFVTHYILQLVSDRNTRERISDESVQVSDRERISNESVIEIHERISDESVIEIHGQESVMNQYRLVSATEKTISNGREVFVSSQTRLWTLVMMVLW